MEQKLIVEIVVIVESVLFVLLCLFTFGFCIPVMEDYKTQLDILKNRGCEVSYEECVEWRKLHDGK